MKQNTFAKIKESKTAIIISAFIIPFVMMLIFWAICGIYPFGEYSILTGDMDVEFTNFYAYFIHTLKTDNDWSYMLTKTLGGDYPGLAAFILHDPLLYILLLFPRENISLGIEFLITLQVSIAGLSVSVLLNNRYRRSWMSLLFSTAYSFSAFFFGYLVLTIYFTTIAILPLVLYFFLEFLDEKMSFVPFVITAALYIYINFHMGFMLVIFLCILYVSRIIADPAMLKRFTPVALAGITVLLIDGLTLVRTGLSLLGEKTTVGADYGFYRRFPIDLLPGGMFSGYVRNDLRPLIYCSVAVFFFLIVFFASSKITLREKIADAFVIAAVAVSMWINALDAVWHGFNNPEGFYWRYAYYISMIAVVLAYRGFAAVYPEGEEEPGKKRPLIISAIILIAYLIYIVIRRDPYLDAERLVINACLVIAVSVTAILMTRGAKIMAAVFVALFLITCADELYNSKTAYLSLNSSGEPLPKMADFKKEYEDIDSVISFVKEKDQGFYRIEKDFERAINDPSMFDYVGLSHDSSCEKDELLDWLVNFGFCKTVYYTYYNGGSTAFVDDFFGIKYYISRFDTVEKPYESLPYEGEYSAYENTNALPMAYIAPQGLPEADISKGNTFEKQNLIASYWNERPIFIKAKDTVSLEGAKEEGAGHYVRTGDEGYIVYDITITEKIPLYLYFTASARQNGEVFVNGESRDVYFTVNHWNVLCAGTYSPGDTIEIRMQIKDDALDITDAAFYYEDPEALTEWGEAAKALNEQIGEVEKIKSSHYTFSTDCKTPQTVMMPIPYDNAWTIRCDGEKLEPKAALGELMSFDVPEGEHVIDMKYTPQGTYAGIAVSLAGILLFIVLLIKKMTNEKSMSGQKLVKSPKM